MASDVKTIVSMEDTNTEFIIQGIKNVYQEKLKIILDSIAEQYKLNKEELAKFCYDLDSNNDSDSFTIKKRRKQKKMETVNNEYCQAKKADGHQCTRRKKHGNYCGKHEVAQKYGIVSNNSILEEIPQTDNNVVITQTETINGVEYLVDSCNIVFTKNMNKPEIVGKLIDGKLVLLKDLIQTEK